MEKKVKAFIARESSGELFIYGEEPKLTEDGNFHGRTIMQSMKFSGIKPGQCVQCTITYVEQ